MTALPVQTSQRGWTVDDSTFGARLALVRQRMDWNIKEAAEACGVPVASWRSWERAGAEPRRYMEKARMIATRTGCDLVWLVGLDDTKGETTVRTLPPADRPRDNRPASRPGTVANTTGIRRPRRIADPTPATSLQLAA
jgi:transcriptional regulator with XRE-family HTH domain